MGTLKDEAKTYEPPHTDNIADLASVPVDIEVLEDKGVDKDNKEYSYKYVEIDGKRYRIAGPVLGGIKALLEKMPDLKRVCVMKFGEGKATRYQVVPDMTK